MARIPSKDEILAWIAGQPGAPAKRDIAKAFGIKGAERIELKRLLKEMEAEGALDRRKRSYRDADRLPPVSVLQITGQTEGGDLLARAVEWQGSGPAPRILFVPRPGDPALGEGDRILGRVTATGTDGIDYEARLIRRIGQNPRKILGVFRKSAEGGRLVPIDKGAEREWMVAADATGGARDGELVEAEQAGRQTNLGLPRARVLQRLGDPTAPRAVSLIAIHQHGIPDDFPDAVMAEADAMEPAGRAGREDLTALPLVTIDPADARDHDDAVWAEADDDPANAGGHIVWVAIADVAHYVRPGSALDREAAKRGNSTYFPDRVVPMLPDRLSGDLCSLHEGVPRPCIAVRMQLDAEGRKLSHRFVRGLMRSVATLSYAEVQAARDGQVPDRLGPLMTTVIAPLYAAYDAARAGRQTRQPLDLNLPERKIVLSDAGEVVSVDFAPRFDAHRLIEEFMILANVAAAEELIRRKRPLLFRVHEEPPPEKIESLREVAEASGFTLAKGEMLRTRHLNLLLRQADGTEFDELINITTLRSMTQAYYSPENFGHFGLALKNYAHFTSPIRRYADLVVHRALIAAHGWGKDGLTPDEIDRLGETAEHISETERRSMAAERDTTDRYLAAYLSDRVGGEFAGRVSGIARFGVFVKLEETGADGLIPIRTLGREFFHYDAESQTLMGSETGLTIGIGQKVLVRLAEAVPVTGGLMLELLELGDAAVPRVVSGKRRGKTGPRRSARARTKAAKLARKVERRRR